jgi:hypothetical protein
VWSENLYGLNPSGPTYPRVGTGTVTDGTGNDQHVSGIGIDVIVSCAA